MSGKSKINLESKISKDKLNEEMSLYVGPYRYYQRLIAIKFILDGNTIKDASELLNLSYPTVHRWAKTCEKEGLEGLKPSFGGGRPSKLSYEELIDLDKIIESTPNLSMKDVQHLVKEKFDVDYSLKQIGVITKKLGYNYSKAYPIFNKSPKNAKEQLKKNLESHNVNKNDIIVFFDEASFLNEPYNSKSLYKQGVKHKNKRNSFKFKSNAIGSLTINGNSNITITNSSTAPEVAIALIELRKVNLKEIKNKISLNNALRNINQPEEEIERILIETSEDPKRFSKKINNAMEKYAEDTIILARIIGKHCKRESTDNIKRKREIRRNLTLEFLKKENIESKMICEERICLILDNYSVHKSAFIKKIAEILNIELIYLPHYSPHLNPIEQLWRKMKRIIRNEYLESKEFLEELTEKTFFNCLIEHNFYDSWFNLFITKVW